MMKKIVLITTFFVVAFIFVGNLNVSYALDCDLTGGGDHVVDAPTPMQMLCPFLKLFNLFLVAGGAVFLIVIVIGAIKMSTALGDPKGLKSSRDTWVFAFIGVFVVLGTLAIFAILDRTFNLGLRHYIGPGGVNNIFERIAEVWYGILHDLRILLI